MTPEKFQLLTQKYGGGDLQLAGPSVATQKTQADMQREQRLLQTRSTARQKAFGKPEVVGQAVSGEGAVIGEGGTGTLDPVNIDRPAPISERQMAYADELIASGEPELVKEGTDLKKAITEKDAKQSPLGLLIAERKQVAAQYGEDHPIVKRYDARIQKETGEEVKGQVIDLGDRMIVVDPTKIGQAFDKGLSPKDAAKGPESLNQKEVAEIEGKLRDDFFQQVGKEFTSIRDSYDRIRASSKNPSAAGDLAMIFNYMKMLDPASVVRESEFANAAATGAFGERIKASVQKVITGERLSDAVRDDFVDRADKLYAHASKNYSDSSERFKGIAKRSGANPENVLPKISLSGVGDLQAPIYGSSKEIADAYRDGKIKSKKELQDAYEKFYLENPGAE
jgi:hypothetical protein